MKIFIIGMNGISMQSIAYITKNYFNYSVKGWDDNNERLNIGVEYSQEIDDDTDFVVYSSGIKENHILYQEAIKKNLKLINRTDFFLKYMPLNENLILVAGAHGKTTTSSIIAYLLGLKSYYLGGIINGEKFSGKHEKSEYTVIETDESDGSFIKWKGKYKILLNFDYEHMIFFKTQENIIKYYRDFVLNDLETTKVIINIETKNFLNIADHPNIITYGKSGAHYNYSNLNFEENGLLFEINKKNKIFLPILGEHNASNFTAIYALFELLNLSCDHIKNFPGVKKRMQKIASKNEFNMYVDYGHHHVEVEAVLNSFLLHKNRKVDVVLEPHKPSRILYSLQEWAKIFQNYKVFLYPMYSADEPNTYSSEEFAVFLKANNVNVSLIYDINSYVPENDTICFSAGILSSYLSK